jgi:hypothetical protein
MKILIPSLCLGKIGNNSEERIPPRVMDNMKAEKTHPADSIATIIFVAIILIPGKDFQQSRDYNIPSDSPLHSSFGVTIEGFLILTTS